MPYERFEPPAQTEGGEALPAVGTVVLRGASHHPAGPVVGARWYALWTHSHSERLVCDQLAARGFEAFLPTVEVWSRRAGTRHRIQVPMFPSYLFVHHDMDKHSYIEVQKTRGLGGTRCGPIVTANGSSATSSRPGASRRSCRLWRCGRDAPERVTAFRCRCFPAISSFITTWISTAISRCRRHGGSCACWESAGTGWPRFQTRRSTRFRPSWRPGCPSCRTPTCAKDSACVSPADRSPMWKACWCGKIRRRGCWCSQCSCFARA